MICREVSSCRNKKKRINDRCEFCRYESTDSNITRQEKRKRYNLINNGCQQTVVVFHVDGGMIVNEKNTRKCDYIYYVCTPRRIAVFIELKGKDVKHALEQIDSTMQLYNRDFSDCKLYARIVCRSVPNIQSDSDVIRLKRNIKRYGAQLKIDENNIDDSLCNL